MNTSKTSLSTKIIFTTTLSFLLGVLAQGLNLNFYYLLLILIGISVLLIWQNRKKGLILVLILMIVTSLGFWRNLNDKHEINPDKIEFYNNTEESNNIYSIQGYISSSPKVYNEKTSFDFQSKKFFQANKWQNITGTIRLTSKNYPARNFGEKLEIKCELKTPAEFEDFSYKDYLARYHIYSVCYYPQIQEIQNLELNFWENLYLNFFRPFAQLKQSIQYQFQILFPEPSSSFLSAILIGNKYEISDENLTKFATTGISHVIALSGLHITLLINFTFIIFGFLPKKLRIITTCIILVSFALLVGMSASVLRATIMGIIGLIALMNYRQNSSLKAICLAGFFMVLFNPKILLWDVGFQLSFLATTGIILIFPIFEKFLKFIPAKFNFRSLITLTLVAQISVLPILIYNFHSISIIAPLTNILIIPIIPLIMLFGFFATIISFLFIPLAKIIGIPAYLGIQYIFKIIDFLAQIPYANLEINSFSPILIGFYYLFLGGIIWLYQKLNPEKESKKTP